MSRNSNNPTGSDPNFCQILKMKLALPRDANFAPVLTIRSVDHRLFGASKPTIGSCRFVQHSNVLPLTMQPKTLNNSSSKSARPRRCVTSCSISLDEHVFSLFNERDTSVGVDPMFSAPAQVLSSS